MRARLSPAPFVLAVLLATFSAKACDLCSVYNAGNARGEFVSGFLLTVAEQYSDLHKVQLDGTSIDSPFLSQFYLENSITHAVTGYNFTKWFGLNVSIPIIHRSYRTAELGPSGITLEEGSISGVGDLSLVSRVTLYQKSTMETSYSINLLLGLKFPTGDNERLRREIASAHTFDALFPPGHSHDLVPPVAGVHQHDLTLGSGSFDGIAGLTANFRKDRWFLNAQVQYYLRTKADGYEFGDSSIISGGPGAYLLTGERYTLSVQSLVAFEVMQRDELFGRKNRHTGMELFYLGPQIGFTWRRNLSLQAGADFPLFVENNGLQNLPEYRLHAGITRRF